jgi:hypothetical protein
LPPDLSLEKKIDEAFQQVVDNESIESIGDFHLECYINHGLYSKPVFTYRPNIKIQIADTQVIESKKNEEDDEWVPISLGTVAKVRMVYLT